MQKHRLAAIMPACLSNGQCTAGRFTDIVGFALMRSDENHRHTLPYYDIEIALNHQLPK